MNKISDQKTISLLKDCKAVRIPSAELTDLAKGSTVTLIQQLGDNYTIEFEGNVYRIDNNDADALGFSVNISSENNSINDKLTIDTIFEQLKTCYDPEIPVNIVDLGLIYDCEIKKENEGIIINITMTLTAPGCNMGPILANDVKNKLFQFTCVKDVNISLVFDPPWSFERLSENAKLELGLI